MVGSLLATLLTQRGYRVTLVGSAGEALQSLETSAPLDCVVIDERLPDRDGWELCRALKATATLAETPVTVNGRTRPGAVRHAATFDRGAVLDGIPQPVAARVAEGPVMGHRP